MTDAYEKVLRVALRFRYITMALAVAGFIGAILSELKITPPGVGDIITYSRSIADYPSMYAAIFSIILLAVLFLNLLEKLETVLFKGNQRGYVSD
jgi:NitT/TauT family transport system permease protein